VVYISQATLGEVERVSAANAERERAPVRKFELTMSLDTEAFGEDSWEREAEVGRILRLVAEAMYGGFVPQKAVLRDRNDRTVGAFRFQEG
jgi:hypothetical protein